MGIQELQDRVVEVVSAGKGRALDLGCGDGRTGKRLVDMGFEVRAFDMDRERFQFHREIEFTDGNLGDALPYADGTFDYVLFMEVIEHIYNPGFVVSQISRVLKKGGRLILTTPNILHAGSRMRFLAEGSFDYFREPPLDYSRDFPLAIQNMHVIPWRYHELEYLLDGCGLRCDRFHVDERKGSLMLLAALFYPAIFLQSKLKERRARRKGGVSCRRINKVLMSWDMLAGRHLILEAIKT